MVLTAITRSTIAINPKKKKVSRTSIIFASVTGNGTRGEIDDCWVKLYRIERAVGRVILCCRAAGVTAFPDLQILRKSNSTLRSRYLAGWEGRYTPAALKHHSRHSQLRGLPSSDRSFDNGGRR